MALKLPSTSDAPPLVAAVMDSDEIRALRLLDEGADINQTNPEGETALIMAVSRNEFSLLKLLISRGADLNISTKHGATALIWAARRRVPRPIFELILSMTKNIDARAEDGATALTELLIRGDFALAQLVIQSGASLHTISTLSGNSALLWAVSKRDDTTAYMILDRGVDLNVQDKDGQTALFLASLHRNRLLARRLIDEGADLNLCTHTGLNALLIAARNNDTVIATMLAEKGAFLDAKTPDGDTALIKATLVGNAELVQTLIRLGACPNFDSKHGN